MPVGFKQAVVKTASGLRGGGPEQIAVETFGDGILDDLGLGGRAEIGVEDLEFETVLLRRGLQSFEARQTIGIVHTLGEIGNPILFRRSGEGLVVVDDGFRGRRHFKSARIDVASRQADGANDREGKGARDPAASFCNFESVRHSRSPAINDCTNSPRRNQRSAAIPPMAVEQD